MSILDHCQTSRVWWDGRRGFAVGPHGKKALAEKPALGFPFVELDYCPPLSCQIRREAWHTIDDLTQGEKDACIRFLFTVR